jgi:hypothetical protein
LQEEIKQPSLENVPEQESNMAEIGKHKLSDAIPRRQPEAGDDKGGRLVPTHETAAKQTCEPNASEETRSAGASKRERMVDIGRANQQAGRQGQ